MKINLNCFLFFLSSALIIISCKENRKEKPYSKIGISIVNTQNKNGIETENFKFNSKDSSEILFNLKSIWKYNNNNWNKVFSIEKEPVERQILNLNNLFFICDYRVNPGLYWIVFQDEDREIGRIITKNGSVSCACGMISPPKPKNHFQTCVPYSNSASAEYVPYPPRYFDLLE